MAEVGEVIELKPCPFCGAEPRLQLNGVTTKYWEVVCDECELVGQAFSTNTESAGWWNGRAPDPERDELREALRGLLQATTIPPFNPSSIEDKRAASERAARLLARLGKKSGYAKKFLIDLLEGEDKDLRSVSEVMFACDGSILVPSIVRAQHVTDQEPKP